MNISKKWMYIMISAAVVISGLFFVQMPAYAAADYGTPYSNPYGTPAILPPADHPRLLFRPSEISTIKANMSKSQNATALSAFNGTGQGGKNVASIDASGLYDGSKLSTIEAWAFDYAINGNETNGYKAVNAILGWLPSVSFSNKTSDACRYVGHFVYTASEVYDWCYPLISAEQRGEIIRGCERIAKGSGTAAQPGFEMSYPPGGQGAVCGHGGEAQLLRDLLAFGIATYNERPDIYNYCAGRILKEYVEPRNFWYASGTHHQGDAYGPVRFQNEVWAFWIMNKMSGQDIFNRSDMAKVPYEWIYNRRPDGQVFRNGDCFFETYTGRQYWNGMYIVDFMCANIFGDPYIKESAYRQSSNYSKFAYTNDAFTAVTTFLINDPALNPSNTSSSSYYKGLETAHYFGSPNGTMIARTGWNINASSPVGINDAVAFMKIGEHWGANHNHLDAGTFQIYYKGMLTGDTGVYDGYGTTHDYNYHKRTIAHNALTIFDPTEQLKYYGNVANDGGQRTPNVGQTFGSEPATMSVWMNNNYQTGEVTGWAYDREHAVAEYSYIAGDITKAYSGKVKEVLRSMLFMPTGDANYPAMMMVMDKITASDPSFKKTFLLHYYDKQPTIDTVNRRTTVINSQTAIINKKSVQYTNGKLVMNTLLPENPSITNVGGNDTSKRFWINNLDYPPTKSYSSDVTVEQGTGRIEVSPPTGRATDYFLNVLMVADAANAAQPLATTLIENDTVAGAKVVSPTAGSTVAVFNKHKTRLDSVSFTVPGSESANKVFVAGLKAGEWVISVNGAIVSRKTVTDDGGQLYFTAASGEYTLTKCEITAALPICIDNMTVTGQAGSGKTVSVSAYIHGTSPDAQVMLAVYDSGGRVVNIQQASYAAEKEYAFSVTLPAGFTSGSAKIFVWNSASGGVKPLAKSKSVSF